LLVGAEADLPTPADRRLFLVARHRHTVCRISSRASPSGTETRQSLARGATVSAAPRASDWRVSVPQGLSQQEILQTV
jgi:hypothetical protein